MAEMFDWFDNNAIYKLNSCPKKKDDAELEMLFLDFDWNCNQRNDSFILHD